MRLISFCKSLAKRNHTYISKSSIRWFGTEYGGFYLDASLLNSSTNLLSFGVGEDVSFDLEVSNLGVRNIFLFDPTPKAVEYVKGLRLASNFQFYAFGLSDQNEQAKFFLPKNEDNVSGSLLAHKQLDSARVIVVELKKLSTIVEELNIAQIDVLKIDIEGSEYKVLKNILEEKIFPTQICVEFHNNFLKNGKQLYIEVITLLKQEGYQVAAVSKSGKELLLIRC